MRRRHRFSIVFPATMLLLAASVVGGLAHPRAQKEGKQNTVIFAVSREVSRSEPGVGIITPIVLIAGGHYISPPKDDQFVDNYYRSGQKYRLLFGGAAAGSVTIKQAVTLDPSDVGAREAEGMSAFVEVNSPVYLGGNFMALATNARVLGRKQSSRRAPTVRERTALLDLARKAYQQRHLPNAQLNNAMSVPAIDLIDPISLTATDLNRDGKAELIGSFEITIPTLYGRHTLFLVAEHHSNRYRARVTWYHRCIADDDCVERLLVDHLDLNGDGIDEVIVRAEYFEAWDYIIYKKQRGYWRSIYKGGGGSH